MVVSPPTLQVTVIEDSAGMMISGRHRNGRSASAEVDWVAVVRRSDVAGGSRTIPHLTVAITSPTLQFAVVKDGAGVAFSSRHRNSRSEPIHEHSSKGNRCGRRCVQCATGRTVAQLSIIVHPPTLQVAVVKDCASVPQSSVHRNGRSIRTEVDRCGRRVFDATCSWWKRDRPQLSQLG